MGPTIAQPGHLRNAAAQCAYSVPMLCAALFASSLASPQSATLTPQPSVDVLVQVEDLGGTWKRQTNIDGFLGLGFCTSNANPEVSSSAMEGTVELAGHGEWHIWVRALRGSHPERVMERRGLRVELHGRPGVRVAFPATHTDHTTGGWTWEQAGSATLPPGTKTLRVLDAEGGFESADAVLFTRDSALTAAHLEERYPTPSDPCSALAAAWRAAGLRGDPCALPREEWAGAAHLARLALRTPTRESWTAHAALVRTEVLATIGIDLAAPRPPLTPIVTQRRELVGYSVEDIAFEVAPGEFVTGNLYRPLGRAAPYAGVLSAHGHLTWDNSYGYGRFAPESQQRAAVLARMGAVVFAYDMVGYGDWREAGWTEGDWHADTRTFHVGEERPEALAAPDTLRRQTRNSLRALDFLLAQEGVDPARIGMTGSSGGGTQTFLLAALDERVKVSAPVVMVSATFQGGCVCETGIEIRRGPRHETSSVDLAALAAPRPQLLVSCGGDWTKHTPALEMPYLERAYGLCGARQKVENVHCAAEGHDFGPSKRRALYDFFARHLELEREVAIGPDGVLREETVSLLAYEDLLVFDAAHPRPPAFSAPRVESGERR
jgi:dienelactone hydrolase